MELCRYAVRLPNGGVILAVRDEAVPGGRARLVRFDRDWRPDPSFTTQFEAADQRSCLSLKLQADGKLLVAGLIGKLNGEDFPGLVRLDAEGAIDRSFRCQIANSSPLSGRTPAVIDLAIQKDGRIVICGFFSTVNGAECPHIARLNPDGSLDGTFRTPFITLEAVNRERFGKMHVPVTQLAKAVEAPAPTDPGAGGPGASGQTIVITSMTLQGDAAVIQFAGASRQQYILQAKDSMTAGDWIDVGTNQANADGVGRLRDAEANQHPMRFYRIASP